MLEAFSRPVVLSQPSKIVFGAGCALDCVGYLKDRGLRRVLVVTSPSVLKLLAPLLNALRQTVERVLIHSAVKPESDIAGFEATLAVARSADFDGVIGIGVC